MDIGLLLTIWGILTLIPWPVTNCGSNSLRSPSVAGVEHRTQPIVTLISGTHLSRRARHARVLKLLASVDVLDQAARKPPELSGNERQRVAIARARANSPGVLLADEPTGRLDPESVAGVTDTFSRLHDEEGSTIVMVIHDGDVATRADRMIRIERGAIVA